LSHLPYGFSPWVRRAVAAIITQRERPETSMRDYSRRAPARRGCNARCITSPKAFGSTAFFAVDRVALIDHGRSVGCVFGCSGSSASVCSGSFSP
jgi:hypothetical protein